MYNNATPALAVGGVGAGAAELFAGPLWAVLAGFAILAAFTALARIVPRQEYRPRHRH